MIAALRRTALLAAATAATTAGTITTAAAAESGDTEGRMTGLTMTDSRGISVWMFDLAINNGNPANPGDWQMGIWAGTMSMLWEIYRFVIVVHIWVLDWVLSMSWLDFLLAPLKGISTVVQAMIAEIGLLNLTLIILACVVGYWLIRGRYAGGMVELLIGCVIAALATGALAYPMETIAGDRGLIIQSRDAGMDLATGFTTDGESFEGSSDKIRNGVTASLVDTMVRMPHQLLNYGSVIDGTGCESTYDENVGADDARAKIRSCDPYYKEVADNPSPTGVVAAASLLTTGMVFGLLSATLALVLIAAVLMLGWQAVKLLWTLPVGVVAGATRGSLFRSFGDIAFGCVMVAGASIFIVIWMKITLGFFDAASGVPFLMRTYLLNIVLIAGAIALLVARSKVKKAMRNLADRMAKWGPSGHTAPAPAKFPTNTVMRAAHMGLQAYLARDKKTPAKDPGAIDGGPSQITPIPKPKPVPAPLPQLGTTARPQLGPGPGTRTHERPTTTPSNPDGGGGNNGGNSGGTLVPIPNPRRSVQAPVPTSADRLHKRLKTATKLAIHAGAAVATGGTSTAVVTGSKALALAAQGAKAAKVAKIAKVARTTQQIHGVARTARTTAVRSKLAAAQRVNMRANARGAVDESTGVHYERATVSAPPGSRESVEILRPTPRAGNTDAADRLRERLAGKKA